MTNFLLIIILVLVVFIGISLMGASKTTQSHKMVIERENKKEMEKLRKMRSVNLTEPLTEKSRPKSFEEVIGQDKGIRALQAALCGQNPQHVIIYGPPGVGKTAAARLVLEKAKKTLGSPFSSDAKFVEIDATTIRFDDRGIADPLIGSVHDPIYQGAGAMGIAGIPQPKPGAVTKAHGGILFIDEIGELHPIELNKLLKVLEDRKVFLDSSYYSSEDPNMPSYIKEVFDNGLPADFRLIGATTRSPHDIAPAIRSRCVEIFFRGLNQEEIIEIAENSLKKINLDIEASALKYIGRYCSNGREVINLIQLCAGMAINDNRTMITNSDVQWVIENGQYTPKVEGGIAAHPQIGLVNGVAVYGSNMGTLLEVEATAKMSINGTGSLKVTGIVEAEEIRSENKRIKRKSTAYCSVENVLTVLDNTFNINCSKYDLHVNFPGGIPVDGPSAGIAIACSIYSAIRGIPVNNLLAMTGEITIRGNVKPVGGITAKVAAAKKAGIKNILIPKDNYEESFKADKEINIIPVDNIKEVIDLLKVDKEVIKEKIMDIKDTFRGTNKIAGEVNL